MNRQVIKLLTWDLESLVLLPKPFFYQGTEDWNSLPDNIKFIMDKNSFKSQVKFHLSTTAMNQELAEYVWLTSFTYIPQVFSTLFTKAS